MSLSENETLKLANEVAYSVVPSFNEGLKLSAKSAGWPENIVNVLSVNFDNGQVYIDYPETLSGEVDDLEYGKPFGLPNPVIRPFIERCNMVLEDIYSSAVLDNILQTEEVF